MINLWYLKVKSINKQDVKVFLELLPKTMVNDIIRFRNHEDQRAKLFAKLMVRKYYNDLGLHFDWKEWIVSPEGKPYYNLGRKRFNISHSKDYVLVAFSDQEIGIDIEAISDIDVSSVSNYFHPEEAKYITSSLDSNSDFFKLWTRKESFLKAIGKGIIYGLHNESCLSDKLVNNGIWYLHSLPIIPGYQISVCTQIPNCQINIRKLFRTEF